MPEVSLICQIEQHIGVAGLAEPTPTSQVLLSKRLKQVWVLCEAHQQVQSETLHSLSGTRDAGHPNYKRIAPLARPRHPRCRKAIMAATKLLQVKASKARELQSGGECIGPLAF